MNTIQELEARVAELSGEIRSLGRQIAEIEASDGKAIELAEKTSRLQTARGIEKKRLTTARLDLCAAKIKDRAGQIPQLEATTKAAAVKSRDEYERRRRQLVEWYGEDHAARLLRATVTVPRWYLHRETPTCQRDGEEQLMSKAEAKLASEEYEARLAVDMLRVEIEALQDERAKLLQPQKGK